MKEPDWSRPSNRAKARRAIGYINIAFKGTNEKQIPHKTIDTYVGRSDKALGHALRKYLLIQTRKGAYSTASNDSKYYIQNKRGIKQLKRIIEVSNNQPHPYTHVDEWLDQQYFKDEKTLKEQLVSGDFEYVIKANRHYNHLQNIPKEKRQKLFAMNGMPYEYDISAASPTILYQIYLNTPSKGNRKRLRVIERYLSDKASFRALISNDIGIDQATSKKILNALFNGASLTSPYGSIFKSVLKQNRLLHYRIKKHMTLVNIANELKIMWKVLYEIHPDRYDQNGNKQRITASLKSKMYRMSEEQVITCIKEYCWNRNIHIFTIHDGWMTSEELDINDLQLHIKQVTGFDLTLDYQYTGDF